MKSCNLILLLLCLCFHNAHHMSTSKGVFKRQTQDQDQCGDIFSREACTNGYYEDYAYLSARCSGREFAQNFQDFCSVNAMGMLCATIEPPDTGSIQSVCGTSPTICSPECASNLTNIRAELGCCVNAYNTTIFGNSDQNSDQFVYSWSLWSLCGVEPVTERCTPSFDLPTGTDATCNLLDAQELLYSRVLCRAEFLESIHSALTSGGCPDEYTTSLNSSCSVDGDGEYCALRDNLFDQFLNASTNCPNTDSCNISCIDSLNSIVEMSGCCFISEFNSSFEEPRDFLSYEFWQRCGLTSPGFCEVRLDTSPTRISGSGTTTNDNPSSGSTTNDNPSSGAATVSATAALIILAVVSTFN